MTQWAFNMHDASAKISIGTADRTHGVDEQWSKGLIMQLGALLCCQSWGWLDHAADVVRGALSVDIVLKSWPPEGL